MRVIIESPYNPSLEQIEARAKSGDPWGSHTPYHCSFDQARNQLLRENIQYARLLYKKALEEGHAPFASHLNYTQVWSEEPGFLVRGIAAGFAWKAAADEIWYGADLRWSESLMRTFDLENHMRTRSFRLFPDLTESQVRAHLASLPWSAFVGVE